MSDSPPGNPPPGLPPTVIAAEAQVREYLARAQWRKARDTVKPLVKADRARYLPLLIQANIGLAGEMMAKGQVSEAQQVLSYLATIAPADQLRALELELAGKSGAKGENLGKLVAALADGAGALAEAERTRLADVLVLTFQPLAVEGPGQESIAAEVRAVHDALLAITQARWEDASAVLRSVPRRSAFSHWVLFLKGVAAFHCQQAERMEHYFAALPPDSVPAKAAQAYLLLADRLPGGTAGQRLPGALVERTCRLAGAAAGGTLLGRAERAWNEGRFGESYRVFRDALRSFPSYGLDWLGALSEFYFQAPHSMSAQQQSAYVRYFDGLLGRRQVKSGTEEMWVRRMFTLVDHAIMPAWNLRHDWELFLRHYEALRGENPRRASLAYGWLGGQLSMVRVHHGMFAPRRPELRDSSGAVEMLQKSIELDPGNLVAHLQLCHVYAALKQTSERNRLLDAMSERFPDDKRVLLLTGQGCIERKAFVKGLDYLARARQLDPLDPAIPELMLTAHRRLARQYFQQGKPDKARQTLARTEAMLTDRREDFQRSQWTALVHHGVMEKLWGDAQQSEALLAQARAAAPGPDAALLFAHIAHRVYSGDREFRTPFWAEFKELLRTAPTVGGLTRLLRLLTVWQNAPEAPDICQEAELVGNSLKPALRQGFTRADAVAFVEAMERVEGEVGGAPVHLLVNKVLRDDPLDPRFRLLKLEASGDYRFQFAGMRNQVQSILDEAVRRQDETSIRKAQHMLQQLDRPSMPPPDPFEPDFDLPEDEPDDEDPFDGLLPPGISPEESAEFSDMIELLRNAPDSVIRKMRKTRPPEMPEYVFDILLELAKRGPLPAPPPRPPSAGPAPVPVKPAPAPAKPAPPAPDPNQLNLF